MFTEGIVGTKAVNMNQQVELTEMKDWYRREYRR
jgi:hypothetical protein